jgi:exodeoxyribonuclease VII large subunit
MPQTEPESTNAPEVSVSELAQSLKRTLEDRFGYIRVRGEITGYRGPHSSGHAYFALKDESARLDAVVWRTTFSRMKFKPQEGLEVVAAGRITTFPGKSTYQIVVDSLEPAGVGALMALLEARRRQLAAEGLFETARKRPLPFLPRVVGVITSPTGSVIRDILHRLADRFPVHVVLWPVRVQGETSAEEVAAAIRGFNALTGEDGVARPDVLIVARGGGSLEDLWSFNEEAVVRAAASSEIPLVSAVGHETDWTLIDHAADVRAPTPTAAAELCVPVRSDLVLRVAGLEARGLGAVGRLVKRSRSDLGATARRLPPLRTFHAASHQRLDARGDALRSAMQAAWNAKAIGLAKTSGALARQAPLVRLAKAAERVQALGGRLRPTEQRRLDAARQGVTQAARALDVVARNMSERRASRLAATLGRWESRRMDILRLAPALRRETARAGAALARAAGEGFRQRNLAAAKLAQLFAAVNYQAVLARGYALVLDRTGAALSRSEEARAARDVTIRFSDGEVAASVGAARRARASRKVSQETEQKTLF